MACRLLSEEAGDPSAMNTLAAKLSQSGPHAKAKPPNSTQRTIEPRVTDLPIHFVAFVLLVQPLL